MNTYFAHFKNLKIDVSSTEKLSNYMFRSGLFYEKQRIVLVTSNSDSASEENANPDVGISEDLMNAFYSYLKTILSADIETPFIIYFDQFNEEVYGLEHIKQKEIGLRDFKKFYNKVKALKGSLGFKVLSDNGVEHVKGINRFVFLKGRQRAIKSNISSLEKDFLFEYMDGNAAFFEKENLLGDPEIRELIEFESTLKILVSLNDQFKFEDNLEFSDLGLLKDIFEGYKDIFESFGVFVYAHKLIKKFKGTKSAKCTSLFYALVQLQLVFDNKKNFAKYLRQEHELTQAVVKSLKEDDSPVHDFRVKKFKEQIIKMDLKF